MIKLGIQVSPRTIRKYLPEDSKGGPRRAVPSHLSLDLAAVSGGGLPLQKQRHQIPKGYRVSAKPILGGLHHEYRLEKIAARGWRVREWNGTMLHEGGVFSGIVASGIDESD